MTRELDRRPLAADQATPDRVAALESAAEEVSARLPGDHSVRVTQLDPTLGVARVVTSEDAPAEQDQYVERAMRHVETIAPVFGLEAISPEYHPDEQVQRTASGGAAVHLQQRHEGIPIFQATETVRFNPDGSVRDTAGSSVPVEAAADAEPQLSVEQAVERAAAHVAQPDEDEAGEGVDQFGVPMQPPSVDLDAFAPTVEASDDSSPQRSTTLSGAPFEEIGAELLWFPMPDGLRLCWEVLLTFPGYLARYRVILDASDGKVLYCHDLARSVAARGNVYRVDGSRPREMADFPPPLSEFADVPVPTPLPPQFPDAWVVGDDTHGNCAHAHLGENGAALQGTRRDGMMTFDPRDATGDDQKVLNIFYFTSFMHDRCYLLGFRERDGNFQQDNFGRGGRDRDPVDARAHSGPVQGTANMATLEDGKPPVMNMGLVPSTDRHTAFDASVVYHECMHGVTNRMVGGPGDDRSLESPQSRGMGEGWSDWIACTINDSEVVGAWVVDRPEGIRMHPYDENYPDTFGSLGRGRFGPGRNEHAIGEVWCATLMSLTRRLGKPLAQQLVFDALRIAAANPGFLDMRNDILTAAALMDEADQLERPLADVEADIWSVFARYGMGPDARSQGAQLVGIVPDFSTP